MSSTRTRRERRRQRSRSVSPQLLQSKRDLRNDLRNNLRQRSRSRSPRIIDENRNMQLRAQQYTAANNHNNPGRALNDEERFYIEQQQREEQFFLQHQHSSPEIELMHHNRRNFRSRSRDGVDQYDRLQQRQLNFEPSNSHLRDNRFSPPDPHLHLRQLSQQGIIYENDIVESVPAIYNNKANPFGNQMVQESSKSNISWQPPPENLIIITEPERPELELIHPEPCKDLVIDIPVFDPDNDSFNSKQYVAKLDELGKVHKWTEEELKFNFVTHLEGRAKNWQINSNRILNPWHNIKRTFVNTFLPLMDYHKRLKDMMSRQMTPCESLKTYFMHKTMLLNQADISGRKAISCLIAGLQFHSDAIRESASMRNFGTSEELLGYITDADTKAKPVETQAIIPSLLSDVGIIQAQQLAKQRLHLTSIICYNCMREGHMSKECPTSTTQSTKQRQIIPKHRIEVSINGITFPGYNDLSSSCVTMREVDAKKANIQFQRHITCIRGFGNASVTALGVARVIIRVDKVMLSFEISIVPNAAQDIAVVIGKNFRSHADVRYVEAEMGISFTQITTKEYQVSTFSANERLMASFNSSGSSLNQQSGSRSNHSNRQMDKQRRRY